ncbi:hypothetical protein PWT90_03018 [Aphanocladium album]|nr:hypothetical protein PWT90_03018 [Aphanocladium album]
MATTNPDPDAFHIWHHEVEKDAAGDWCRFELHLAHRGARFRVIMYRGAIISSPITRAEYARFCAALAGGCSACGCAGSGGSPVTECAQSGLHGLTPLQCVQLFFPDLLRLFPRLAPAAAGIRGGPGGPSGRHRDGMSLAEFYTDMWAEYHVTATDELLSTGVAKKQAPPRSWVKQFCDGFVLPDLGLQQQHALPDVAWVDVQVRVAHGAGAVRDDRPRYVEAGGKTYRYRSLDGLAPWAAAQLVEKYARINVSIRRASLPPATTYVEQAFAIVRNERCAVGLLLEVIDGARTLKDMLAQSLAPLYRREAWKKILLLHVKLLHSMGVSWANVTSASVLIDARSKPHIIDYGTYENNELLEPGTEASWDYRELAKLFKEMDGPEWQ